MVSSFNVFFVGLSLLFAPIPMNEYEFSQFCEINGARGLQIESEEKFLLVEAKAKMFIRRMTESTDAIPYISFWTAMR